MFWIYLLMGVVTFVGLVGWLGRRRGSAKEMPDGDIDAHVWDTRARTRGRIEGFRGPGRGR